MLASIDNLNLYVLERSEIPDFFGLEIHPKESPVLVAFGIQQVQNVLIVLCPEIMDDSSVLIVSHGTIIITPDGFHPDIKDIIDRSEISHPFPVRGNLGAGF
jgi:hypothetical protein